MNDRSEHAASRFGWFAAGIFATLAGLTVLFFAGDWFGASDVEASTPRQIIVGQ